MKFFQKAYDWFKKMRTPVWWKNLMGLVQVILIQVGQEILETQLQDLKNKIMEVDVLPLTGREKFNKVYTYARHELVLRIPDNYLDLLIQSLVSIMKGDRTI